MGHMEFICFGDHDQVPPRATPIVVVGAISRYLPLNAAFTMKI